MAGTFLHIKIIQYVRTFCLKTWSSAEALSRHTNALIVFENLSSPAIQDCCTFALFLDFFGVDVVGQMTKIFASDWSTNFSIFFKP